MRRWLKALVRQWVLDGDTASPDLPSDTDGTLDAFQVGEIIPLKGLNFRVGRIAGGEFPVLLLAPIGPTRGAKLKVLRDYRDEGRAHLGRQMMTRKAVNAAWKAAEAIDDRDA